MHRDENTFRIALNDLEPVLHVRDLLIAYALNAVVVDRYIVRAGVHHFVAVQRQQCAEIFNYVEIYVLLVGAVYRYTAAVESAVGDLSANNGCIFAGR